MDDSFTLLESKFSVRGEEIEIEIAIMLTYQSFRSNMDSESF